MLRLLKAVNHNCRSSELQPSQLRGGGELPPHVAVSWEGHWVFTRSKSINDVDQSHFLRHVVRHCFNSESKTTIGVDCAITKLQMKGKSVRAQICDMVGGGDGAIRHDMLTNLPVPREVTRGIP
jgi:hypothetical protein